MTSKMVPVRRVDDVFVFHRRIGAFEFSYHVVRFERAQRLLMSMFAFAFSATGRNSFVIADFLSESKSWPQSANNFLATSSVIHERADSASMFLFGLSSSKFSFAQLDLTTCHR